MTATVTKLPAAKRSPAKRAAPRTIRTVAPKPSKASVWQARQGYLFGGVAATVLAMSLEHLASGVTAATHGAKWEGIVMAVAIDIGFVSCEVMPFTCKAETLADTRIARLGYTAAVLGASAWFNTVAFSNGGPVTVTSAIMGVAVPAIIGVMTHLASRCLIGRSK